MGDQKKGRSSRSREACKSVRRVRLCKSSVVVVKLGTWEKLPKMRPEGLARATSGRFLYSRLWRMECPESSKKTLADVIKIKMTWFMFPKQLSFLSGGTWKMDWRREENGEAGIGSGLWRNPKNIK